MTPEQAREFAEAVARSPAFRAVLDQLLAHVRELTAIYRTLPADLRAELERAASEDDGEEASP